MLMMIVRLMINNGSDCERIYTYWLRLNCNNETHTHKCVSKIVSVNIVSSLVHTMSNNFIYDMFVILADRLTREH